MFSQAIAHTFTVWDPAKTVNVTFSGGNNLTATTSAGGGCSGSKLGPAGGKYYCELTITTMTTSKIHVGLWNNGSNIGSVPNYLGLGAADYSYDATGIKTNNSSSSGYGATFTVGDIISIYYDATGGTVGFMKNGADQGQAYGSIPAGLFVAFSSDVAGAAVGCTANFGATPLTYTPPAGYQLGWFS